MNLLAKKRTLLDLQRQDIAKECGYSSTAQLRKFGKEAND